jgi:hypothetical protein
MNLFFLLFIKKNIFIIIMRKYTRKFRRQNRKSRSQRKSGKRRVRSETLRKMIGGEDPKLSSDIYNYTISDLPHRVSA